VGVIVDRRRNTTKLIVFVCVDNDMKTNLVPFFLQFKNKPHDKVLVHLFLSSLRSRTVNYMGYTEKYKPPLTHGPHRPAEPRLYQKTV
jgi:hypothetical protein